MRRDVHYYFQQALRRQSRRSALQCVSFPLMTSRPAFPFSMAPGSGATIEADVEYRCTTCITLVAICEHIAEEWRGATVRRARSLTAERILEQHPEIPPNRHSRAYLAAAAAKAALEDLSL